MMSSPTLFEAAFNSSPIGNYLLSPSPEAIILAVNNTFLRASGRKREDLVGISLFEAFPGNPDDANDAGEAALRQSLARVLATGEPDTLPDQRYPIQVRLPSGEIGYEERFWNAISTPVFAEDGRMLCISHTTTDVTDKVRAEAALRENESRYRALSNATVDVIYRMNPDWTQMHQLEGRGFLKDALHPYRAWLEEYIPSEDQEQVSNAIAEAIRNKSVFELEHRVRRIDGTSGWTLSRAVPMLDANGDIYEWIGAASDITERKKTERRYQTLFASIDEGFCIIDVLFDANSRPCDYRFCEVNPAFEAHTGLHNVIGKTVREMNPQHEQHWFDIYAEVLRTGQPTRFEDGSDSLDRYFDVYAFRIEKEDKPKVAVLFKDISAQKRAFRRANESEQRATDAARRAEEARRRLAALLQAAPVGIVMSNTDGGLVLANAEHNRLWGAQSPVPKSKTEFAEWKGWWADGSERHGRRLTPDEWPTASALRGEEVRQVTVEIKSFSVPPVRRTILVSGAPVQNEAGETIGAVIVQMDITDRVRAEEALRLADRRKDEFLAMLAHELRNPLAPISAAADLLAISNLDQGKVRQTSTIISRQVKHMAGLMEDLLDVSRVTRGLVTIKREKLDIRQVVTDAIEQVRPLLEVRGHHTVMSTPSGSALVTGDRNRLVQVVANLLSNAAKYTPAGGNIRIAVEVAAGVVNIDVTDNGIGMEPELIPHAFELFTQARRTSDRSQGGLGIGLALVKSLVELHDGRVTAQSEGTGKGGRFTVSLPYTDEKPDAAFTYHSQSKTSPAVGLKILIVDDNQDAAQMLSMYVEALGHEAIVEHEARNALHRARVERPQVCLLDIGLPDMDGNELARQLRKQPETEAAVLVAVSGYGQEQDRMHSREAGFDYHFVKPVDAEQLVNLLNRIGETKSRFQ